MHADRSKGRTLSDQFHPRRAAVDRPQRDRPARPRRAAVVRRVVTVAVCFALGVALAAGVLLWQSRGDLLGTRIAVNALGQSDDAADEPLGQARTVLVVGDDSGEDLDDDVADLGTGERLGHRTDTVMLTRIDPEEKRVTGVHLPRDLYVERCDGSMGRINGAWEIGGPDCLVETVRDFANVTIDHYVQVDFAGFVETVDAIGGVTMYLDEPMDDEKAHVDLPAGCITLDGRSALGFVRSRADSDLGRIARQQRFIKELASDATELNVLANPARMVGLVDAVGGLVTTDDELGVSTLRAFADTLRGVGARDISMATVPTTTDDSDGVSYERPVEDETRALLDAFREGTLPQYLGEEAPEDGEGGPAVPLDELAPIAVLNASDVGQLAGRTAAALEAGGVAIAEVGNASPEPLQVTIAHPPELAAEAESLRDAVFPTATLDADDAAERVTVILNSEVDPDLLDVAGLQQVASEQSDGSAPTTGYANADPPEDGDAADC
jgi:LCP family protein required for cell wall assembly